MAIDQAKLDQFMTKMLNDMGAAATGALVLVGDKLGLYKALAQAGPIAPAGLAAKTKTAERYVKEWLAAQAAAGYVQYDAKSGNYSMTPEQAAALADENSPAFVSGAFGEFEDLDAGHGAGLRGHEGCWVMVSSRVSPVRSTSVTMPLAMMRPSSSTAIMACPMSGSAGAVVARQVREQR